MRRFGVELAIEGIEPRLFRDLLVTGCGHIRMHRKRINISTLLAGQRLGIETRTFGSSVS